METALKNPSNEKVVQVENLIKDYRGDFWKKKRRVLNQVSFEVSKGDVFGFLGPNGAGKTTTLKIIMGLVQPTSGVTRLFGFPSNHVEVKSRIGFLPENPYFYEYLKTEEFLGFYGELFGLRGKDKLKRIDYLIELVGMNHARGLQLRKFSKGMLQRVGIAQALINDPELVILDEPQTGLDPIGRHDVRSIILQLKEQGKTIFFSSHILPDVEMVCDKVGIIIGGQMRDVGYIQDLLSPKIKSFEIAFRGSAGELPGLIPGIKKIGDYFVATVASDTQQAQLVQDIYKYKGTVISVTAHKENLEDLFMAQVENARTTVKTGVGEL